MPGQVGGSFVRVKSLDFAQPCKSETHTTNSSLSAAVTLNPPSDAQALIIEAFTQNVRFTVDGATDPTNAIGFLLEAGERIVLPATQIRVIEVTSGAEIEYQWVM
jgi:hypothetical protein